MEQYCYYVKLLGGGYGILTGSVSPMIIFACRTALDMPLLVAAPHRKIARSRCVIFSIKKMLWVTGYAVAAKHSIPTERPATI